MSAEGESLSCLRSARPFQPCDMSLGSFLGARSAAHPGAIALRSPGPVPSALSYDALYTRALQVAHAFAARFAPGERLVIWCGNRPEWTIVQFGAAMAGLVIVAINPGYAEGELRYFLKQSGAQGIVYDPAFRGRDQTALLEAVRPAAPELLHCLTIAECMALAETAEPLDLPDVGPDDPVLIQYTSGTTGSPKGAILSHRGLLTATQSSETVFALPPGSGWVNPTPMYTTSGSVFVTMMAMWNGGTHLLLPGFDPELIFQAVETWKGAFVPLVPTMALAVLDDPRRSERDLSALQVVVVGGAPVAPELVRRIDRDLGADVMVIFGQTEACSTLCLTSRHDTLEHRTQTIGYPLGGIEVRIADPVTGATLPAGSIGEICARGPSVMKGYHNMPEASAAALDAEGWLKTGDLGSLDPDGYLRLTGRLKELIIRGGSNIYPREIEAALAEVSGIADSAVFGVPDPQYGEAVVTPLRLREGASFHEADLRAALAGRIAKYKIPNAFWVVDAFTLTASGKVQKHEMRQRWLARAGADLQGAEPPLSQ